MRLSTVSSLGVFVLGLCLAGFVPAAHAQARKTLDIYVVDVEGGNATLFVTPSGESVLIDTGNPGAAAPRDAGRIMAAVKDADITQIDNLITTHWHGDHFGGMSDFASRITIKNYIDHGPNTQPNPMVETFLHDTYPELYGKAKHMVAKPGDKLAVAGVDWNGSSGGTSNYQAAGGRRSCKSVLCGCHTQSGRGRRREQHVRGKRGDLWKISGGALGDDEIKEQPLMCPINRIGTVDLSIVLRTGSPCPTRNCWCTPYRSWPF